MRVEMTAIDVGHCMECEEDETGSELVELYVRLRNELGADFRGMDPIDSRRAPIAMLILHFATQNLSIAEIESAVRSALGLPNNEVFVRHKDSETTGPLRLAPRPLWAPAIKGWTDEKYSHSRAVAAFFASSPTSAQLLTHSTTPSAKSGAATDSNSGPSQKMAPQSPSSGASGSSSGEGSSAPPTVADPDAAKSDSGKMHPNNPLKSK